MFEGEQTIVNQAGSIKSTMARALAVLGSVLAPPRCVLCDQPGLRGPIDLCGPCLADLPARQTGDIVLAAAFDLVCCPWSFDFPVDAMIRALKFHGERSYARLLGALLARARLRHGATLPEKIVPVPLHPLRLRTRGYNQAAELARFAARELSLPLERTALRRHRATREQTALRSADRVANVRQAFAATRALHGARLALVDDVVTTGSTVRAAAEALRAAGAVSVELWVVACARRRPPTQRRPPSGCLAESALDWAGSPERSHPRE